MKYKMFIAGLLLLSATTNLNAQAPTAWKQATSGGYTYKYVTGDPTRSRFYTLKNGLTVILSPTAKQPRIQTFIAVKAGSKTDPANHTGLAHYLEHMLFKGTDKIGTNNWAKEKPLLDKIDALYEQYNATTDEAKRKEIYKEIDKTSGEAAKFSIGNEYDKIMTNMGGQNSNAFTSFEQTVYTEDIPSNAVDRFLALQAERFRNPIMRIFHTELEAVYEEKNRTLDDDGRKVTEAMFAALFPSNPYGKQTTIGTVEHLKNPSLNAIRNYYYSYYVPNNMGIIFSGDFNPDVMIKKIATAFSYMKPKDLPPYEFKPEAPITSPVKRDIYGPNAENVTIAFRFPGAATRDARMLDVMSSILTNGKAGLLDLNLVKKQKLLSAGANSYSLRDASVLMLRGNAVKGQTLDEVRDLMLGELAKLRNGDFSADLIPSIVNNEKKSIIQQNESYVDRANNLMWSFTSGTDWKTQIGLVNEYSKITKQQIIDFANKYLNNQNYVLIYKHQGEDKNIIKVEKPAITPVEMNAGMQSPYLEKLNAMPMTEIKPVWLDFNKDIQRGKAGNLDLLAVQNKDNSLFRLYYRFNMGNWNNKLLPIAAQYLQFLGTDTKTAEDYSKAFYKLASSYSVGAGSEITTVSISGLQENFTATVKLFEDLLANCKADEAALAGLKARLKKSRENYKINKGAIMQGLMNYAQYGANNPFNYGLTNEELDALKAEDLVKLLHELNNYKHIVLYYGPKTAALAGADVARLHKTPASFTAYPPVTKFTQIDTDKSRVLFANYDMVQAELYWVRNEGVYNPEQTAEIDLFNNYFGAGGFNCVLYQDLRESKALAYSAYSQYVTPSKKGERDAFIAYIGTQADKLNDAAKGMNDLLNTMPEAEKVIVSSKASIRKAIETERVTQDDIIFTYLAAQRKGINYDIRRSTYANVEKLDLTAVKKFHNTHLKGKPFTYCVVASEKRVSDDDLKKYGELVKPDLKEIFGY